PARERAVVQAVNQRLSRRRREGPTYTRRIEQSVNVLLIARRCVRGIVYAEKCRPRGEVHCKLRLGGFQLRRCQETTDTCQIRHKLRIEGLPAKSHRIEAVDIVTARLKLIGLEEELRYMDPVAFFRMTGMLD